MTRVALFGFFLVSGFCGLVYEIVWLRLAMASFGATSALVAIVLSVFMAGLALGSWGVGRLTARSAIRDGRAPARLYALAEIVIGSSAVLVPAMFSWGRHVLTTDALGTAWGSLAYYVASGAWVAATLLLPCLAMGATFPLAMAVTRQDPSFGTRTFSFLYTANVLGATLGTLAAAFVMIELLGFRRTLLVAGMLNMILAATALLLSSRLAPSGGSSGTTSAIGVAPPRAARPLALVGLFLTGTLSLAFEIVWIRQFAPFLGTVVYAFATILAIYLAATFVGSWLSQTGLGARPAASAWCWPLVAITALFPLATADLRFEAPAIVRVVLGIAPFCGVVGYVTPMLVDRWSGGDPRRAGAAYAVNVIGAIVGPLAVGFWLLPALGERTALLVLAVPLFVMAALALSRPSLVADAAVSPRGRAVALIGVVACALLMMTVTRGSETAIPGALVRRDHTATVVAVARGAEKALYVNGHATTILTPLTKMMAHLPLAMLETPPANALVICFGMGTSFRSALTWGIPVTVVELVPSVPGLFGFFHPDASAVLAAARARIVIDDGRRYLERSSETWDVITLDPPYPVELAGSSVLYAKEFYAAARRRLRPRGLLQQWVPRAEPAITASAARALKESFPFVRVFFSANGPDRQPQGLFFVAGVQPIAEPTAEGLTRRLPPAAARDLVEWQPATAPREHFEIVTARPVPIDAVIGLAPAAPTLTDDRPVNEYYLLRRLFPESGH